MRRTVYAADLAIERPDARVDFGFSPMAQALASRGYAVFAPNFRGSRGLSAALQQAGYGQWGRAMQTDISDGVASLAREGVIDPKRVCILGGGYGGYAALAGVTLQSGVYRCAVAISAPSDLASIVRLPPEEVRGAIWSRVRITRRYVGLDGPAKVDVAALSPLARARQADAPILLIHGAKDERFDFSEARRMDAALKAAGKQSELLPIKDPGREFTTAAERLQSLEATVAFLKKHNPPG